MNIKRVLIGGSIPAAILLVALASISVASAALTFSDTGITGDSSTIIDATGTISIGASSATGITIGKAGVTATFPGTVTITGTTTTLQNLVVNGICTGCGVGNFTAAGDLSGTSALQTVIGLQGRAVSSTAPTTNQILTWDGTSWIPANAPAVGTTTTLNGISGPSFIIASTTYLGVATSGTTLTLTNLGVTTTMGNWQGTWQGINPTTFYTASNPNNYISSTTGSTLYYPLGSNPAGYLTSAAALGVNGLSSSTFQFNGTANQITVATGTPNVITWSLPQSIATASTPTFAGLTISGNATTTGLTIIGLGSTGNPCLVVSAAGVVSTSTCGSVGGLSVASPTYTGTLTGPYEVLNGQGPSEYAGNTTALYINGTTTDNGVIPFLSHSIQSAQTLDAASNVGDAFATIDSADTMNGGGFTWNHYHSFQSRPDWEESGTISEIVGLTFNPTVGASTPGTGGPTLLAGLEMTDALGTGPIGTEAAVYVGFGGLTRGTSNYFLFSGSPALASYIGGKITMATPPQISTSSFTTYGELLGTDASGNFISNPDLTIVNGLLTMGNHTTSKIITTYGAIPLELSSINGNVLIEPGNTTTATFSSTGVTMTGNATTTNLAITALGTSASNCLTVNAAGKVATTTCGGESSWISTSTGIFYSGSNVGIGTSAPAAPLEVNGNIQDDSVLGASCLGTNASGTIIATSCLGAGGGVSSTSPFSSGYIPFATSSLALTNSSLFQLNGNIGIGTTTPGSPLTVYGSATNLALTGPSGSAGGISIQSASQASAWYLTNRSSASTLYLTYGNETNLGLAIETNGNLGIGTSTPSQLLTVGNNNQFTVASSGSVAATGLSIPINAYGTFTVNSSGAVWSGSNGIFAAGTASDLGAAGLLTKNTGIVGWSSGTNYYNTLDTGLSRLSAGVVGIGNGIQGNATGTLIASAIGIGTAAPSTTLQLAGTKPTIRIGASSLAGCIEVGNSDGSAGINYITVLNGVITATTTQPNICQ